MISALVSKFPVDGSIGELHARMCVDVQAPLSTPSRECIAVSPAFTGILLGMPAFNWLSRGGIHPAFPKAAPILVFFF